MKNFDFIINFESKKGDNLMKNDLVWTKTILTVYRYLERIAGAMDKIMMQSALNSSNILGHNFHNNNIYSISQKLIDLSQRKITLINLKVLVEDTLKSINKTDAQILIERYIDSKKCKEMADKRDISMRTIFRKISLAEKAFDKRLHLKGYTSLRFDRWLCEEGWIKNVYSQLSKNDEDFVLTNFYLAKAVSM